MRASPVEFQPSPQNSSHNTLSCHGFQQLPSPPSSCSCSSSSLPAPSSSPSLPSLSNPSPLFPNPAGTHSRAAPPPSQHLEKRDYGFKKEKQRAHPAPGATDNASNNKRNFHPAAEYSRFTSQALPGVPKEQLHLDFGFFPPSSAISVFKQQLPHGFTLIPIYCRGEITQIQNDLTALLDSVLFQVFHET